MGEWERGLEAAVAGGLISEEQRANLVELHFERETSPSGFPIRLALYVLGAMVLAAATFAAVVRLLGDDPSQLLLGLVFLVTGALIDVVARLIRRSGGPHVLSGIAGAAAGVSLGISVGILLPGDPNSAQGAIGALMATAWSLAWFARTGVGLVASIAISEAAVTVLFFGDWAGLNDQTTGAALCAVGLAAALASVLGRIRPSLPPLVAALAVVGVGCIQLGTYGGVFVAVLGGGISAGLFLVAYRRREALMSAATAISTGVWAVVLSISLTSGALVPLIVAAIIGIALIVWGSRLPRR